MAGATKCNPRLNGARAAARARRDREVDEWYAAAGTGTNNRYTYRQRTTKRRKSARR